MGYVRFCACALYRQNNPSEAAAEQKGGFKSWHVNLNHVLNLIIQERRKQPNLRLAPMRSNRSKIKGVERVNQVEKFKEYGYSNLGTDDDGMDVMGKHFENGIYMVAVIADNKLRGLVRLTTEQLQTLTNLPKEAIPK